MLQKNQIERLKANWGAKAESMEAMAEVRIYNTLPNWECFIYAMNPDDEDHIMYIWNGSELEIVEIGSLSGVAYIFNHEGDYPKVDQEFHPRSAKEILKKLRLNG